VIRRLAALAAAVAVLAACGDQTSDEETMVSAIRLSILQDETFASYEVTGDEATCVAESTVDGIGVERLEEIGFDDDEGSVDEVDLSELSDTEIEVLSLAMDSCIEGIDRVLIDTVTASILDEPAPTFPIDEDEATCVAEAVVDDIPASRLIAIGVRSDHTGGISELRPTEVDVFADAYTDCIDVREILLSGIASGGTSDQVLQCLDDEISDDDIGTIFRAGLAGEDAAATAQRLLAPAVETCTARG
jgi:hypothetical protein